MGEHPLLARWRSVGRTLNIAHRGGAALAPENTMVAFAQAVVTHRADTLELDIHRSKDGVMFISHDPTVDRCTDGSGPIAGMTAAELQRLDAGFRFTRDGGRSFPFRGRGVRLPTLAELFAAFPGMPLNIDLKEGTAAAAERLGHELRKANAMSRVCCGSEDDAMAVNLARLIPEACHFYPKDALTAWVLSVKSDEPPPDEPRFQVLDMPAENEGVWLVDEALVRRAREAGKWINVWTIDEEATMRRLMALGVGGIMTDRPDRLDAVLQA